jgi:hypothetical protein
MKQHWTVIALIYSGRPDPRWDLSEEQTDHFLSLWRQAGNSETETVIPSVSGYKGIRILSPGKQFLIYNGIMTVIENQLRTSKRDDQRSIERFLLNTSPPGITTILKQSGTF